MSFVINHICCPPDGRTTVDGGVSAPIQITSANLESIASSLETLLQRTDELISAINEGSAPPNVTIEPAQLEAIKSLLEQRLQQTNELKNTVEENGGTIRAAIDQLGTTLRDNLGENIKSIKDTLASLPTDLKDYFGEVASSLSTTVTELNEVEERLAGIRSAAQQGNDILREIQQTLNSKLGLRQKAFWKKTLQIMPSLVKRVTIPAGAVEIKLGSTPNKDCYEFCDTAKIDHFTITDSESGVPVHYRPGMAFEHNGMHGEVLDPSTEMVIDIPQQPGAVFYLFVKYPQELAPPGGIVEETPDSGNAASAELDQGEGLPDQGVAADQGTSAEGLPGEETDSEGVPVA